MFLVASAALAQDLSEADRKATLQDGLLREATGDLVGAIALYRSLSSGAADDDLRADRGADNVVGFGRLDVLFRQRQDFAERKREVERRMRDRAEIRVRPGQIGRIVGHDREIDLFAVGGHGRRSQLRSAYVKAR